MRAWGLATSRRRLGGTGSATWQSNRRQSIQLQEASAVPPPTPNPASTPPVSPLHNGRRCPRRGWGGMRWPSSRTSCSGRCPMASAPTFWRPRPRQAPQSQRGRPPPHPACSPPVRLLPARPRPAPAGMAAELLAPSSSGSSSRSPQRSVARRSRHRCRRLRRARRLPGRASGRPQWLKRSAGPGRQQSLGGRHWRPLARWVCWNHSARLLKLVGMNRPASLQLVPSFHVPGAPKASARA